MSQIVGNSSLPCVCSLCATPCPENHIAHIHSAIVDNEGNITGEVVMCLPCVFDAGTTLTAMQLNIENRAREKESER